MQHMIMNIDRTSTLIIFDWDDTLFPTTWTMKNNIDLSDHNMISQYRNYFDNLDRHIYSLLNKITGYGEVIIITNATLEWLDLSCSVLPQTKKLLKKINVISARERYQNLNVNQWKINTFIDEIDKRKSKVRNIISIGDAEYEYKALVNLFKVDTEHHKYLKAIRFIKSEDNTILLEQLMMLEEASNDILWLKRHLDFEFAHN